MSARSQKTILLLALLLCVFVAWQNRFTQDDAYISWTYAKHLVEGRGLVWANGQAVEGYTNFLWTLIATIPLAFGWEIETFFYVLGMLLYSGSLVSVYALTERLSADRVTATCALLSTGLFFTFSSYATGGLETQLQTFLVLQVALGCLRLLHSDPGWRAAVTLGLVVLLAELTRLDSIVLIAPMFACAAFARVRREGLAKGLHPLVVASTVVAVGMAAWLAWKLSYYGSILPNSFRAKVHGSGSWLLGFKYVRAFLWSYLFVAPLIGGLIAWVTARRDQRVEQTALLALPVLTWLIYVAAVGGDFMEFRLLVVVIPLAMAICFVGFRSLGASPAIPLAVMLVVLGGSEYHRRFYNLETYVKYGGPEPIESLIAHVESEGEAWREIGMRLNSAFHDATVKPTIAVTAAGAIVFYGGLPAIDMLGINDTAVAGFTPLPRMAVGHNRLIPLDELLRRRAHFLVAHPVLHHRPPDVPEGRFTFEAFSSPRYFRFENEHDLRGKNLIEVPLSRDRVMLMIYLTEDPAIDRRLVELGWRVYPSE